MLSGIIISHDEFKEHRQEIKSALKFLKKNSSSCHQEKMILQDKIEQLLRMAREIKNAKKSVGKDPKKFAQEHFCEKEHARDVERMRTIVSVLWPIYKEDLNNLK